MAGGTRLRRDGRLVIEKKAERPEHLTPFYRNQDPVWKRITLALR